MWILFRVNCLYYRGQLAHWRYKRVLATLTENFPGFKAAVNEYIFEVAKQEAASLPGQVLPSRLSMLDVDNFNYASFYVELQTGAPVLHSVLRGSMAGPGHYTFDEVMTV